MIRSLVRNYGMVTSQPELPLRQFDFLFRNTPGNLRKLKAVARSLGAMLLKPYYPVSGLFRMERDEDSLQVDFMSRIDGV